MEHLRCCPSCMSTDIKRGQFFRAPTIPGASGFSYSCNICGEMFYQPTIVTVEEKPLEKRKLVDLIDEIRKLELEEQDYAAQIETLKKRLANCVEHKVDISSTLNTLRQEVIEMYFEKEE